MQRRIRRLAPLALATAVAAAVLASSALAHIERPAYWPDPRPDRAVVPAAGGRVPHIRSLTSALRSTRRSRTRVVCQPASLRLALRSVRAAERRGFRLRPSVPRRRLARRAGTGLASINRRLFARCRYHQIQPAVSASRNDDRIVIMPGVYREPRSRRQPTFDPRCHQYLTDTDFDSGGHVGLSYRYQFKCPNDQNLIAVLGRSLGPGTAPAPRPDRHGIPASDLGRCIRCNLQIEGSGARPEDVVIDSGRVAAGNHGPNGAGSKKDVAMRVDRADGFVLRNLTVRHAKEHDVYVMETDGYRLDRVKFFYAGEYGELTFAADHGLTQNCEGVGNGDSAVYPGGAPETGDDPAPNAPDPRDESFYPRARLNQRITRCDLHHNNLAYSGTMGNATHVDHNEIYDNTTGIATDSFFAGGHPGFPQSSSVFEHNRIYANNFDDYVPTSDVRSDVGVPLGTGILIAGGNGDTVRGNRIYDNWRRGTMLIAVPDAISCPPGTQTCNAKNASSTSYGNRYEGNVMGVGPGGRTAPNGVDFWWDQFPGDTGNCWRGNVGPGGSDATWTGDPARFPTHGTSVPGFLPEACGATGDVGTGNADKEAVLAYCANAAIGDPACEWYVMPPRPGAGSSGRSSARSRVPVAWRRLSSPPCRLAGDTLSCALFADRP